MFSTERGPRPHDLETRPGPGPTFLARAYGTDAIALYRRDAVTGACTVIPPHEVPPDTEVAWVDELPPIREATADQVRWTREPHWREGVLHGTLEVTELVVTEWGVVWSPRVQVSVGARDPEEPWWVDGGVCGGELCSDQVEWDYGVGDSHSHAVAIFLGEQAPALWAMVQQAP